jgi:phage tail tape-measure protein
MSVLSTKTKARIGVKTAKQAAKHPRLAVRGARGATPVVRGAVKMRAQAPRVAGGVVVGALAMYFLDPASGDGRRRKVLELITPNSGSGDQNDEPDADTEAGGPAHPAPGHMPAEHR